ncbi:MAG: amidohydrolase [Thermoproteota archaeon]
MANSIVLVNGKIYISFNPSRTVEAIAVLNGRVFYVGSRSVALEISNLLGSEVIDLQGKTVMPGFVDSHMHLDGLGSLFETLDLRGCGSIRQLKEKVKDYARENREAKYIVGCGWDQELFEEKRLPTRWDIDDVIDDRPVILSRICGHAAVLNSKALDEIEIHLKKRDSSHLLKDRDGRPTGIVIEELIGLALRKFTASMTPSDFLRQFQKGMRCCISRGITTLDFVSCSLESFKALQFLDKEGKLLTRVRVHLTTQALDALSALGIRGGYGSEMLKIVGVKTFADGSLGARTAWISFPYADSPTEFGVACIREDELTNLMKEAEDLDLQLATHGIGDRAIDLILSVYAKAKSTKRLRHRIEHCSIVRDDQIRRIKELGITVTIQPHFVITDWWVTNRIGNDRAKLAYPFKMLLGEGILVGVSTDCPVEPLNPWETIYAAITRGTKEGIALAQKTPEQKLTIEETLSLYTLGSAYVMNEENQLGTLEPGKYADFIVLEKDPFSLNPESLRDLEISETYVGGRKIYPP